MSLFLMGEPLSLLYINYDLDGRLIQLSGGFFQDTWRK